MKEVKCNFKNITNDDKVKFKNSDCLLLISVGQESHEGSRFSATIDLINTSFKSCIISLYDSIQRHTMALNSDKPPEFFHTISVKEGDLWLERNRRYIDNLSVPNKILRWDMWLKHLSFGDQKIKLTSLLKNDPSYKSFFDITIDKYLERYCKHLTDISNFDMDRARKLCFDYVLEECVVLCLWLELNCQFEVYPNIHNDAIEETRKRLIFPHHPDLLRALTIRFRNSKQLKPQQFISYENAEKRTSTAETMRE